MSDATPAPAPEDEDRSFAGWATKPRSMPGFLVRPTRSVVLYAYGSLEHAMLAVAAFSAAGLVLLALVLLAR